jgi:hypothetical protein
MIGKFCAPPPQDKRLGIPAVDESWLSQIFEMPWWSTRIPGVVLFARILGKLAFEASVGAAEFCMYYSLWALSSRQ